MMQKTVHITCISASNIEAARQTSASTRACELVRDRILELIPQAQVQILPLLDYDMLSCRMCGKCFDTVRCARDTAFNQVFESMIAADALFFVCPHYAPIPSKVMILLEKLEEMLFLRSCAESSYHFPLYHKPIGIIAHGGQTAEALLYYKKALLDQLANSFASVQMKVIGAGPEWPTGAVFGITSITQRPNSIFVDIHHDWEDIRRRITPLVDNVVSSL